MSSAFSGVNLIDRYVDVGRDPRPVPSGVTEYQTCEIIPETGNLTLSLDARNVGAIPVASILL